MAGHGIRLGAFALTAPIGRGGMGQVWRAEVPGAAPRSTGRDAPAAAVKVLAAEGWRTPALRGRFREEVFAVARLHHAGIVRVYDQGTVSAEAAANSGGALLAGAPFLAMELATGGTLADWRPPVDAVLLVETTRSLLAALAHAHARGVIHRDIKPANVLLAGPGDLRPGPKLTDFGLAHVAGRGDADGEPFVAGTPAYMAPEQVLGRTRDQGPWTDLYALGCLVWELATGAPPFLRAGRSETARAHVRDVLPPFAPASSLPGGLERWLQRLLAKEPARRFQLAADAAFALETLAAGGPSSPGPSLQPRRGATPAPTTVRWQPDGRTAPVSHAATRRDGAAAGDATIPDFASHAPAAPPAADRPPVPTTWAAASAVERVVSDESEAWLRRLGVGLDLWGLRTVPFVGRRAERDVLWGALRSVASGGRARALVLRGAAGTGKTRLAAFVAERAEEVGAATALWVRHGEPGGAADGFAAALRRRFRCEGLPRDALRLRVREALCDLGALEGADADVTPPTVVRRAAPESPESHDAALAADFFLPPAEGAELPTEAERDALVVRLLGRLAARRPLVLCVDDAQWGYESLGVVQRLLDDQDRAPAPILVLVTVREDALADRPLESQRIAALLAYPDASPINVGPLPARDHVALVQRLVGLDDASAARLAERTGGNPQFAVQLVGAQVQSGALVRGAAGFRLPADRTAALPADLHAAWQARLAPILAATGTRGRSALELAAVGGERVVAVEWAAACGQAGTDDPALREVLVERLRGARLAGAVEGSSDAAPDDWFFTHAMLRDAIVAAAREGGRLAAHHDAWAAALGPRFDAGERVLAARLAGHQIGAGSAEAAVAPLLVAVEDASRRGAHALAADLLDRHEAALDRLGRPHADRDRSENRIGRARVALDRGALAEARRHAQEVRDSAAATGDGWLLARAQLVLADVATREGRLEDAQALLDACRGGFARVGDAVGVARSLEGFALLCTYRGAVDAAHSWLEQALAEARRAGDPVVEAGILLRMAHNARFRDRTGDCLDHVAHARALYDRLDSATGVGRCLALEAEVARGRGELTAAEEGARRALSRIGADGSAHSHLAPVEVGLVLVERRLFDEARRVLLRALESLEGSGQRGYAGVVHALLLPSTVAARDGRAFEHHLGEARERLQGLVDPDVAAMAERAGAMAAEVGERGWALEAWRLAHEQWLGLGRTQRAAQVERASAALGQGGGSGSGT